MKQDKPAHKAKMIRKCFKLGIFLGFSLLLIIGIVASWQYINSSQACSFCHVMKPETVTWQASSHNRIPCNSCHAPKYYLMLRQDLGKKYLLPIEVDLPIPDQVCNQCHDMTKRVVTPGGDIKISHTKHLYRGIHCVQCHSGVAHGNIVQRQVTIDADLVDWTAAKGKAQMATRFTGTAMQTCLDCHQENNISASCDACHTKIVLPESHKTALWLNGRHGLEAREDLAKCNNCHSNTNQNVIIPGVNAVGDYARTNTYCYDCHSKAPPNHDDNWRTNHGKKAAGNGRQDCMVCHSFGPPKITDRVTKTYCDQCHRVNHSSFDRANHPIPLPAGTRPQKSCTRCHPANKCTTCHLISG